MSSSFLSTSADVVVHLLHAGFVDAPVLAAGLADHGLVLGRQHGGDVHARRVVPDEERLVGLLRIVAVEEVDDLGRDFLVHRLRPLQRQRALVPAHLVLARAVRGLARRAPGAGASGIVVVLGSTAPGTSGTPGIGVFLHGGATVCSERGLVDVGEAHPLHRVEVIEVAPVFLEAVRRRQGRRCGRRDGSCRTRRWCSRDRAGTWRAPECRAADRTGCRAVAAGSCRCAADTCR